MTDAMTEVGAVDEGLRLWVAREGVRQAEQMLAAQDRSFTGMQARATAILGWSATGTVALATFIGQSQGRLWLLPVAALLFAAAGSCVVGLWPRDWYSAGHEFSKISVRLASELEHAESFAQGYEDIAAKNRHTLWRFARCLQVAWLLLLAAGPVALVLAFS